MEYVAFWQHTDGLSKALFFVLMGLSVVSWVTLALRLLTTRALVKKTAGWLAQAIHQLNLPLTALSADNRQRVVEQALLQQLGRIRLQTEQGLPVLGSIAAIAPFIGLFGTVWGIFHALHAIGMTGKAGLGQVAGPVGESLIMTGLGLAVAIPAVLGYNLCLRQHRILMARLQDEAHTVLMQQVVPAFREPSQSSPGAMERPAQLVSEVA